MNAFQLNALCLDSMAKRRRLSWFNFIRPFSLTILFSFFSIFVVFNAKAQNFENLAPIEETVGTTGTTSKILGQKVSPQSNKSFRLVYFWATWCPTCKEHLKDFLPKLQNYKNLEILTVVMDKDLDRAQKYLKDNPIIFPVLRDNKKEFTLALKITTVPVWALYELKNSKWNLVEKNEESNDERLLHLLNSRQP